MFIAIVIQTSPRREEETEVRLELSPHQVITSAPLLHQASEMRLLIPPAINIPLLNGVQCNPQIRP